MANFTDIEFKKLANIIHECLKYGIGDNFAKLKNILSLMKNDNDVQKLFSAYGYRNNYLYGLPLGKPLNLIDMIRKQLKTNENGFFSNELNSIRKDWENKKITFKI
jgi:hypothetical protein